MRWSPNGRRLTLLLAVGLLAACGGQTVRDSGPARPVDLSHVPDAVPKVEPRTRAGNKSPYTVFGRTYYVMPESEGYRYRERGVASWYGRKFHGRKTSNGETYDMYAMTAAHKTLPIPTYAKVTNVRTGASVIVRINDRGPFVGDRIIDLSYAAAQRLGFTSAGTALVDVAAIDPRTWDGGNHRVAQGAAPSASPPAARPRADVGVTVQAQPDINARVSVPTEVGTVAASLGSGGARVSASTDVAGTQVSASATSAGTVNASTDSRYQLPGNTFLQAGAFGSLAAAEAFQGRLQGVISHPVSIREEGDDASLFKVRIGPIVDNLELVAVTRALEQHELGRPFVVYD